MNVTIVGAGNMGLAMAAYIAVHQKASVTIFSNKQFDTLRLYNDETQKTELTTNFSVTSDSEKAFSGADMVFVTYPAFLRERFVAQNAPYFQKGSYLCFVPGYGGIEYSCSELIEKGVTILGFQRVPYVARKSEDAEGVIAGILSMKKELFIGTIPRQGVAGAAANIEQLLDIPVRQLKEYLSITLAPSNPLLHITGLYHVFHDHHRDDVFESELGFYAEWDDEASRMLFAYDAELQAICRKLAPLDLSEVVPLPVYYESPTPEQMTKKLKSIEAFKAVKVPLRKVEQGYHIDLDSRMFIEDYPFGVCIIKDLARMLSVDTPTVDELLLFYERLSGHSYFDLTNGSYTEEIRQTGAPGIHGIRQKNEVISFYSR